VTRAGSATAAEADLRPNPLGPVVVEGCCPSAGQAEVTVLDRADGEVRLDVTAQSPATIVVNQAYQSGWEATVDGAGAPVLPANVLFMAVEVPAGHHVVDLNYRPASVVAGGVASGAGILFLAVLILIAVRAPAPRAPRTQ
jgi:uncharacterized membrane protein YfhO